MTRKRLSRRSFLSASAVTALTLAGTGTLRDQTSSRTGEETTNSSVSERQESCPVSSERQRIRPDDVATEDETGNHWLAFAWARNEHGFGRYESSLRVPCTPPVHDGRVVFFYFPAFQSYSGPSGQNGYILQPVLAWNWGGSGQWEIATWSGSSKHGFEHSELIPVSPGDELRAVIERPDSVPGRWYLEMRNRTTGEVAVSRSHRLGQQFRYAYLTMEANRAYDPGNCGMLPAGTEFSGITLEDWHGNPVYPDWNRRRDEEFDCDIPVDVHSTDHVALNTTSTAANEPMDESSLLPDELNPSSWLTGW